ncbi:hypothetical protein GCM10008932_04030 [Alkalibacterium iburiense]|uniref:NERD domain-containing protein n=1 Tax=Alkalibacterium iburiense TaxID=290589 RepID=A0ABP3GT69_9LACT
MQIYTSSLLNLYEELNARKTLCPKDAQKLSQLRKGHIGESQWLSLLNKSSITEAKLLNGLVLIVNDQTLQMDTLLIRPDALYLYEVKNYKGVYLNGTDTITSINGNEYVNPLLQLSRTSIQLRQWLKYNRFSIPVKAFVVYINSDFTLYNANETEPVILPTQINAHLKQLSTHTLPLTDKHDRLFQMLCSAHQTEAAFQRKLPTYTFEELKKCVSCLECHSLSICLTERKYYCQTCHSVGPIAKLVIKQVEDFRLLFPRSRITTAVIYDWCNGRIPKKRIWTVLKTNFIKMGSGKGTYYE